MPNHYNVLIDGEEYFFLTRYDVAYKVIFLQGASLFETVEDEDPHPLTELVRYFEFTTILPTTGKERKGKGDPLIAPTIAHIIEKYFESYPDRILVYICASNDRSDKARNKLFDFWYRERRHPDIIKYSQTVTGTLNGKAEDIMYVGLIYHTSSEYAELVKNEYVRYSSELQSKYTI